MNQVYEILNSKLSPPGVVGTIVRKRLKPLFSAITDNRLTIVTAGAGFGKSTAIAQALQSSGCPGMWYRLDDGDADPVTFINYIIAGIRRSFEGFGERILKALNEKNTIVDINKSMLTLLVNEIESGIKDDFIIVLDDCHEIYNSTEVSDIIQFFADHLPPNIHIVMNSRREASISLSRYRTRLDVNEIGQDDLEFTAEEISELFNSLFGARIPGERVKDIFERTEGWAAGLILFYHLYRGKRDKDINAFGFDVKSDHTIFSEYLGENVFEDQPAEIREFLISTSILSRIETGFCNRFLEIEDSRQLLSRLEQKHLFTTRHTDDADVYSYHHLFQEFLRGRLKKEKGEKAFRNLHFRAATLYEETNSEAAINHYLEAHAYVDVFRLLQTVGYRFFSQGRHTSLDSILKKIPEHYLQTEPWALLLKAKLYASGGQLIKSVQYSQRAYNIYTSANMNTEAEAALVDLGRSYFYMGDFYKAEETFLQVEKSDSLDQYLYLEILGNLVFTTSYTGDFDRSDAYYKKGRELLAKLDPAGHIDKYQAAALWLDINYGFRFHFAGEFTKSLTHLQSVSEDLEQLSSPPLMAHYCHLTSVNNIYLGQMDVARKILNRGFMQLRGKGFQGTQKAWLGMSSATIYMFEKEFELAIRDAGKALEMFRLGGNKWGEASTITILAVIYNRLGKMDMGRDMIMEGFEITGKTNLPWVEGKLYYFAAVDAIEQGDFRQAEKFLEHSEKVAGYSMVERCSINVVRAKLYYAQEDISRAVENLMSALSVGEKFDYGSWIFFELDELMPLYLRIYGSGFYKNYIETLLKKEWENRSEELYALKKSKERIIRQAVAEIIEKMPKPEAPPLSVVCFGTFRVFAGSREILPADWKSNKAKEIFKYLVYSRKKGAVPRDVLLELLWPEEDAEKTVKRLHVALPALRKTLEPDVRRGESSYLIRENDMYRIDLKEDGIVDVDLFTEDIRKAKKEEKPDKKLNLLIKAVSSYVGEYFAEDLYTDWCSEEREVLKRQYLAALEQIIDLFEQNNDMSNCIKYAENYLATDHYAEEIYYRLMGFYRKTGNYRTAIKLYEKCCYRIAGELGCPVGDEITALYNELMNQ